MNWADRGNCRHTDQDIFFPKSEDQQAIARAMKFCGDCRVKRDCLLYSIKYGETVKPGIWGGMPTVDRKRLRRALSVV